HPNLPPQNRSSTLVLQALSGGAAPTLGASVTGGTQQWRIAYLDCFITLASTADGRMIEASAGGDNAAATFATATSSAAQQWEMLPTSDGWFLLRNRQTRTCLDNIGVLTAGATVRLWTCGGNANQQWRLIR
uniref:RICIN domain-containing protein n=1 Tax=uncultured Sphingomonas sp. TaxID=158754 RepID=UPI0025868D64